MRPLNSTRQGDSWLRSQVLRIWEKALPVPGYDARQFRRDSCGAWIRLSEYGKGEGSEHGWHIDHIRPVSMGGDDSLENLQPLHWANNLRKGDRYPFGCEDCALREY